VFLYPFLYLCSFRFLFFWDITSCHLVISSHYFKTVWLSSSRVNTSNKRPSCPKWVPCLPTKTTCAAYWGVPDLAFFNILILNDKTTMLSQKVKIQLPSDMGSYPRKTETSSMLLQKPKNSFFLQCVFSEDITPHFTFFRAYCMVKCITTR
jgi:hypothetical protein